MNDAVLPPTLAGLQRAIARGEVGVKQALQLQADRLLRESLHWRCVVQAHDISGQGSRRGALAGIGLAHKDIFALAGRSPGCGSRVSPMTTTPHETALCIGRLDAAGATNLAALTMAEFACGATGENAKGPEPVNPIHGEAVVGGSSSGSAAAVAAGLCYASLGTDTAGSVRIPAATCGLVGLKPTQGLISTQGVFPLAPSLDTVGIIARSAADAAQVLLAVQDPTKHTLQANAELGSVEQLSAPRPWRVQAALSSEHLADDVALALDSFIDDLRRTAIVRDAPLARLKLLTQRAEAILHVEAAQVHRARLGKAREALAPSVRAIVLPGLAIPPQWYAQAIESRASETHEFCDAMLTGADLLLVPALARGIPDWSSVHSGSPRFDARELLALYRFMPFVNYLGLPSIVFPIGVDARKRPVCVQAIARPYAEFSLLAFAYQIERQYYGHDDGGFASTPSFHNH